MLRLWFWWSGVLSNVQIEDAYVDEFIHVGDVGRVVTVDQVHRHVFVQEIGRHTGADR